MDIDELQQRIDALRQEIATLRVRANDPYLQYELQVAIWKLDELDAVCFRCGANAQAPYLSQADRMLAVAVNYVKSVRNALQAMEDAKKA